MEEKQIIIRVNKEIWKELKKISYENEISLNKLGLEAFEFIIKKYQKRVDTE